MEQNKGSLKSHSFAVDQEKYQGPLEAVIFLLRKRKLHVSDVNLARVTDEFVEYIQSCEDSLPQLSDFIRVMSVLLLIKTKALLPKENLGDDDDETIAQFEADLIRIEILQELRELIEPTLTRTLLSRVEKPRSVPQGFIADTKVRLSDLAELAKQLCEEAADEETFAKVSVAKLANLKTTIEIMERRLMSLGTIPFKSLITAEMSTPDKVVNFIAILELLKQNRCFLRDTDEGDVLQYGSVSTPSYGLKI